MAANHKVKTLKNQKRDRDLQIDSKNGKIETETFKYAEMKWPPFVQGRTMN